MIPLKPPLDWFDQPEPDYPEPLTVEPDGRVHGHLAPWDGCHSGMVNGRGTSCVRPPRSTTAYKMFHLGELETEEGQSVSVGKVVVGSPHADINLGLQAATSHYDKVGSVGAFVRAKDGRHGIWLSGALRNDITPEQLRDLRANPPSGDWRGLERNLELIAACAVPVPGYGIPAMVAAADTGEIDALILQGFGPDEETVERGASYVLDKRVIADELETHALTAAVFSAEQRQRLAKTGAAMPDGSFPIRNCSDWQNARQAIGRAPASKRAAVRAHIAKRGRALGCSSDD